MMRKHLGLGLTEAQRAGAGWFGGARRRGGRWPPGRNCAAAFLASVRSGPRIALANSQPGAEPPPEAPVPRWGWGEAPPYPG